MRYRLAFAAALAALTLSACTGLRSGPGVGCDECALNESTPVIPSAQDSAAAASARNGQDASNQPQQIDPGRLAPITGIGRGSGDTVVSPVTTESRSQAGAPSVNQGLILPAVATASTGAGGSPAVQSLQRSLTDLQEQYRAANARGDSATALRLEGAIDRTIDKLIVASTQSGTTTNTYNLNNARIVQSVANGANAAPGRGAIDEGPAKAIGDAAARAVQSVMERSEFEHPPGATGDGSAPPMPQPLPQPMPNTPTPGGG